MTIEYENYLAHYGVKGQKWGVRNWQNADGSYTQQGAERYWGGGHGRAAGAGPQTPMNLRARHTLRVRQNNAVQRGQVSGQNQAQRPQQTPEQIAARKSRRRKILAISAGVTLAAVAAYAGYKHAGNVRDKMRSDMLEGAKKNLEMNSRDYQKFWNSKDRGEYNKRYMEMMTNQANRIDRKDAVGKMLGLDLQSRERKLADLRDSSKFGNWLGDANRRGDLNEQISKARKELKRVQGSERERFARQMALRKEGAYVQKFNLGGQYDRLQDMYDKNAVGAAKERLNELLKRRASGRLF